MTNMSDIHPPDPDDVRAALEQLNDGPTEEKLRRAITLLTGFTDAYLAELSDP